MTHCIGRIGGTPGDWFAELDFDGGEAVIVERGTTGERVAIATVPLGAIVPETDDYSPSLQTEDATNKRLCAIVFAPEAWALLKDIRADIEGRYPDTQEQPGEMPTWAASIVDQIERTLDCLNVPGRGE